MSDTISKNMLEDLEIINHGLMSERVRDSVPPTS
jgi:hypothetical protein